MNKAIERRLAAAERRLKPPAPQVFEIRGGFTTCDPSGDPTFATVGSAHLDRAPDESFANFKARAIAAAAAARERFVIIGGLAGFLSRGSRSPTGD
jgi:hypothetical protein